MKDLAPICFGCRMREGEALYSSAIGNLSAVYSALLDVADLFFLVGDYGLDWGCWSCT